MNDEGLAGSVFHSGKVDVAANAYTDKHFNKAVELLCTPIRTAKNDVIRVARLLNKASSPFNDAVGYSDDDIKLYCGMEWDRPFQTFEKAIKANSVDPLPMAIWSATLT
jgi:hypothetical protein